MQLDCLAQLRKKVLERGRRKMKREKGSDVQRSPLGSKIVFLKVKVNKFRKTMRWNHLTLLKTEQSLVRERFPGP